MRFKNVLLIVSLIFLHFSCDKISQAYKETFDLVYKSIEAKEVDSNVKVMKADKYNLLEDSLKLAEIQEQLKSKFPDKVLNVYPPHIYFENDRVRLQLADPDIPGNIDWYYYELEVGDWEKKDPVKSRARDTKEPISIDEFYFSAAQAVYRQLIEKSKEIEGAEKPTSITFSFHVTPWNWSAIIRGTRSDYQFKADKEGRQMSFEKL